jgi:poly-gamma-glutamate capsule biosynthesis protein CapA/YwtB (metallophosphatase superfamily)
MSLNQSIYVFFCGDVMTGRGIDQILPYPGNPVLYESYVRDARDYVAIAEAVNGPIPGLWTSPTFGATRWKSWTGLEQIYGLSISRPALP